MTAITKMLELEEETIAKGMETFLDVGRSLKNIRDQALYRDGYATFVEYLKERWGWSKSRAYQLISAAECESTIVDEVGKESHVREVVKAPAEKREEVVKQAKAKAESEDRKPTANDYREAVAEIVYEDAPEAEEQPEQYDAATIKAFGKCELRLATLRQIVSMLSEVEIQVLKDWIND